MLYACKMGPIDTEEGSFCAFFGFTEAGMVPPVYTADDDEGLRGLREHVQGEELCCEKRLAKAGVRIGYKALPPPAWVAAPRANMAFGLSLGPFGQKIKDFDLTEKFLGAAARFWHARVWRWWGTLDAVHMHSTGTNTKWTAASIMGAGGHEVGIALYRSREDLLRLAAGIADQERTLNSIAVTFHNEPEWAARAIDEGFGVPAVPHPMRVVDGEPAMLDRETLAAIGAALEAVVLLNPENLEAEAVFDAGDLRVSVKLTMAASGN